MPAVWKKLLEIAISSNVSGSDWSKCGPLADFISLTS